MNENQATNKAYDWGLSVLLYQEYPTPLLWTTRKEVIVMDVYQSIFGNKEDYNLQMYLTVLPKYYPFSACSIHDDQPPLQN